MDSITVMAAEMEQSQTTTLRVAATEFKPSWGQPAQPVAPAPALDFNDDANMDDFFSFLEAERQSGTSYNMRDEANMDELFAHMGQASPSSPRPAAVVRRPKVDAAAKAELEARIAKAINDGKQAQVSVDKIQAAYLAKNPEEAAAYAKSQAAAAEAKAKGGKGKGKGKGRGSKGKGSYKYASCWPFIILTTPHSTSLGKGKGGKGSKGSKGVSKGGSKGKGGKGGQQQYGGQQQQYGGQQQFGGGVSPTTQAADDFWN
jgi:hypothetical protein